MPLQRQHVDVRLGPFDTNVDAKTAPVGVMELVQNAVREKTGEYIRRTGRSRIASAGTNIPPGGSVSNTWQLASYKNNLVKLDVPGSGSTGIINLYEPTADVWVRSGTGSTGSKFAVNTHFMRALSSELTAIYGADSVPANPDIAFIPGTSYAVCVFDSAINSGTICEVIFDAATNKVVTSQYFLGYRPKVISDESTKAIVAYVTAGTIETRDWTAASVASATPTAGSTPAIPAVGASARTDLYSYGGGGVVFAYLTTTPNVVLVDVGTGGFAATVAVNADESLGFLKDPGLSGRVLFATATSAGGGALTLRVFSTVGALVGGPYTLEAPFTAGYTVSNITGFTTNSDPTGNFVCLYDYIRTTPTLYGPFNRLRVSTRAGVTLTTGTDLIRSVSLRSKVWTRNTRNYVMVTYDSDTGSSASPSLNTSGSQQGTYFAIEVTSDPLAGPPQNRCPVLKVATGTGNGRTETSTGLTSVVLYGLSEYCGLVVQKNVSAVSDIASGSAPRAIVANIDVCQISYDSTLVGRCVEFADSLIVPLGVLSHFDGRQLYELGFNLMPEQPSGSIVPGGALSAGVYFWAWLYRRVDAQGRTHRGAPMFSSYLGTTVAAGDKLSWGLISLKLTGRETSNPLISPDDDMQIETYRTEHDGQIFYLADKRANNRTVDTINIQEGDPDTSVAIATQLYTTGDVLENVSPPQLKCLTIHRERMFGVNADDPQQVWYTKPDSPGEGPGFNDALTFRCPEAVTAMASMDDKLVLFSAESIFVVTGDGPNNLGENTYAPPQRVVSGVGCLLPRSTVYTPDGLWFHSPKGIYLLTRGLDAMFAGAPVQDYVTTTIDAVHVKSKNQVRFYQEEGSEESVPVLVYDYHFKEWWLWDNQRNRAAAQVGNEIYTAPSASPGIVDRDNDAIWSDDGVGYRFLLRTSWIATGGMSGFQRLYETQIIGQHVDDCFAKMAIYYDYLDAAPSETAEVQSESPFEFSLRVARQKCAAFKLDIMDDDGAGGVVTTAGFRFSGIGLDVGVKAPLNKLASARRMT